MRSRLFDTGAHSLLPISDFANILCRQINPIDTTPQISVRLCGWFLVSSGTHLPMPSGTRRQTVHSQRTSIKMNCGPILRSEEHTSEPSHQIISYAVFCLKKKKKQNNDILQY